MDDIRISHDAGGTGAQSGRTAHSVILGTFRRSPRRRLLALGTALLLAACVQPQPPAPGATGADAARAHPPVRGARPETAAEAPTPLDTAAGTKEAAHGANPLISPGTGTFVAAPTPRAARVDVAADGDVSFNFVNADVREVVREILGNQLHLNYVIDNKIQAMITAQTGGPVPREAVLPTLESVLRANGLALVQVNGLYRVLAIEDAAKSSAGAVAARGQAGYAVRVLPLHFVAGSEIKSVLEPFLPPGSVIQVDAARNLLIVSGAGSDMDGFVDLVRQFDVDWLTGTSFALYPLRVGNAKDVASELEAIFGEGGSGALAGLVRILPIERLNAILVISPHQAYLGQVKTWVDRLDYGDDQTTPRVFEYHVQNSRAADLAAVLTQLLSSGSVSTVQPEVAPGMKLVDMSQQGMGGSGGPAGAGGLPTSSSGLSANNGTPGSMGASGGLPSAGANTGTGIGTGTGTQSTNGRQTGSLSNRQQALQPGLKGGGDSDLKTPAVRIVADEKNNALVVFARPRDYKMIEDAIKRLDVVPLQVLIEATIAEVTLNDNLQYGLQWFFSQASSRLELNNGIPSTTSSTSTSSTGVSAGAINLSGADISPIFPGFNYLAGGGKIKVILNALATLTQVNVVSSPELLVLDHQTAALQVGDQVPVITQSAQSTLVSGAPIVNSVQYLNTGVVLQVTPRVNSTGLITLDIDQSVSDVAKTTTSTIDSPTITQRRIVTSAVVQDGETIALGGLIIDNQTNGRSGVPLLSSIPLIGPLLFSSTNKSSARTELLVMLTPKILRNAQEARATTDELRNRMRAVKPLEQRIR
jgi:general secretion pathway protein D